MTTEQLCIKSVLINTVETNFVEIKFLDIEVEYHKNFIEKLLFISMEFRQKLNDQRSQIKIGPNLELSNN